MSQVSDILCSPLHNIDRNRSCPRKRGPWYHPCQWLPNTTRSARDPPFQSLRARPRRWRRQLFASRHPCPGKGRRTHLTGLRHSPGHCQGPGRVLRKVHRCLLCHGAQKETGGLRPHSAHCGPETDGTQEVRWPGCPCSQAKEVRTVRTRL